MLSPYAKNEWLTIIAVGFCVGLSCVLLGYWPFAVVVGLATFAVLTFFRDPERRVPSARNAIVAPADGKVSSIHDVEHFPPFDGPAVCVRIFMSVFDVHVNRCPCHGKITSITHQPGKHRNTLNPESAEDNESMTSLWVHPVKGHPIAAVRQIAGLLPGPSTTPSAKIRSSNAANAWASSNSGSTSELYLPKTLQPEIKILQGQKVLAGITILATVVPLDPGEGMIPQITLFANQDEDDNGETSVFAEDDKSRSTR